MMHQTTAYSAQLHTLIIMTNLQMRTLSGYDRTGGKKGIRAASRMESSQSQESLDALKLLRQSGQEDISAIEAAKAIGGGRGRFAKMVATGRVRAGTNKLMNLDSLISWVAKGVAQSQSRKREGIGSSLDWLNGG